MSHTLLAVDLGLRCGLALYGDDGRLRWYRSTHLASRGQLRRALPALLDGCPGLQLIVAEGDRHLAQLWQRAGERRGILLRQISAERWRDRLLLPREQRSGPDAKRHADRLARQVIDWSGAPRPTRLRHDAAEAILIGLWAVLDCGWLTEPPPLGRRGGAPGVQPRPTADRE